MIALIKRKWVCNAIAAAFAFLIVTPLAAMVFDRKPGFTLSDGYTVPATIERGGKYSVSWVLTAHRYCPGEVYQTITDSEGKVHTTETIQARIGTARFPLNTPVRIIGLERTMSSGVALGPATIVTHDIFYCNPLHYLWPINVTHPPVRTTILP